MARRQYSNIAVDTTLVSGINDSVTSFVVADATGWPSAPFVAVLEPGTSDEELVLVGGKSGTTFSSITRGYGGSSAVAHNGSDPVKHVIVAEDLSLIWTHQHTASGGDDTAQLSHDDLSGVSADDHHAKSHTHDGADGSGTLAANSVGTTQIANNAVTTAKIPDDNITAAKIADGVLHEETDESTEVATFTLSSSFSNVASVTLTIPGHWGSWKCEAYATFIFNNNLTANHSYDAKLSIDSVDSQTQNVVNAGAITGAIGARRTGIVSTGSVPVRLRMQQLSAPVGIKATNVFLYARAVRTS